MQMIPNFKLEKSKLKGLRVLAASFNYPLMNQFPLSFSFTVLIFLVKFQIYNKELIANYPYSDHSDLINIASLFF